LRELPSFERSSTFAVVSSHGVFDEESLEAALALELPYTGLVTSRKRRDQVFSTLRAKGVSGESLARVSAPAGLDLGARQPQEIALWAPKPRTDTAAAMQALLEPSDRRLSAVVLAAGLSSRMSGQNKLLLPVRGVPLVRRSVLTVVGHPFAEVVVVTGHESARVETALDGVPVCIAFNPRYEEGQMTSVRAGIGALSQPAAGVMVCLADQPSLTTDDLATIARAFLERTGCAVLVPTFRGARGNPIVLSSASLSDILGREANFGCKQFVAKNADLVTTFAMPNDHVLIDLDRPEDYEALRATAGGDA
jgi:molybdenum cofactor cytidylyltransferase